MKIMSFNYNDKSYAVFYKNDRISYAYLEGSEYKYDLIDKEIEMIKEILSKLLISGKVKNYVILNKVEYNNKVFQTYYDKEKKIKFFLEIVDNKYDIPKEVDYKYLLNAFSMSDVLYSNNKQTKKGGFKKVIEYNKKYISVNVGLATILLSLGLSISSFPNRDLVYEISSTSMENISNDYNLEDAKKLLSQSLLENNKLNVREKEVVEECFALLDDNLEYIDIDMLCYKLRGLDIKYSKKKSINEGEINKISTGGSYFPDTNLIYLYGISSVDNLSDYDLHCLRHEISHVFQNNHSDLCPRLQEATNEVILYETVDNYSRNSGVYTNNRICLYALCELVDDIDVFKTLHFLGDETPLVNELRKIIDDEEKAYNLLNNINLLDYYYLNNKEKEEETKNKIYDTFSEYFMAKKGYPMDYNYVMMAYLVGNHFIDKGISELGYFNFDGNYFYTEDYFSSNFSNKREEEYIKINKKFNDIIMKNENLNTKEKFVVYRDIRQDEFQFCYDLPYVLEVLPDIKIKYIVSEDDYYYDYDKENKTLIVGREKLSDDVDDYLFGISNAIFELETYVDKSSKSDSNIIKR